MTTTTETTAPPTGQLAAALAAAQAEITDPTRNQSGQVRGRRDYKYAGLSDLLAAVRPVLSKHGIAAVQVVDFEGDRVFLLTRLLHGSGVSIDSRYPLQWTGTPQDKGAELTYAKRHSLAAIVGVAESDDDDGSQAQAASPGPRGGSPEPPHGAHRPRGSGPPSSSSPPAAPQGGARPEGSRTGGPGGEGDLDRLGVDQLASAIRSEGEGLAREAKMAIWAQHNPSRLSLDKLPKTSLIALLRAVRAAAKAAA